MAACGGGAEPGTVADMCPTPPPVIARHGTLRARPLVGSPALPVRPAAPRRGSQRNDAPLAHFVPPSAPAPVTAFRYARLDRGRLHAPDAVAAAGLEVLGELEVRLAGPNRLRLRRRRLDDRAVRGTSRPHVDAGGRILLSTGLRRHLGVEPNGAVVLWVEQSGEETASGVLVVAHPGILVAALGALDEAQRAEAGTTQGADDE